MREATDPRTRTRMPQCAGAGRPGWILSHLSAHARPTWVFGRVFAHGLCSRRRGGACVLTCLSPAGSCAAPSNHGVFTEESAVGGAGTSLQVPGTRRSRRRDHTSSLPKVRSYLPGRAPPCRPSPTEIACARSCRPAYVACSVSQRRAKASATIHGEATSLRPRASACPTRASARRQLATLRRAGSAP